MSAVAVGAGGALSAQTSEGKRAGKRNRMIRSAEIIVDGAPIACILLDLSPRGAHLYLADATPLPHTVMLRLPGDVVRAAHLRWRRQSDLGFEFAFDLEEGDR